jgi:hypothetical protein
LNAGAGAAQKETAPAAKGCCYCLGILLSKKLPPDAKAAAAVAPYTLLPLPLPNRYWLPNALPCAAAPSPVVPQQNSYTQNIVDFDRGIGVFSTNPSTYFSDCTTDFFEWYAKKAHE